MVLPAGNGSLSNLTPYQLRSLVLDFLCHHCYMRTARAFARDSTVRHLDADGDEIDSPDKGQDSFRSELSEDLLRRVELREKIRVHILSGRVDEATTLLNAEFPSVISATAISAASENRQSSSGVTEYVASTSIDPAHISLNLQILAFIEACRTIPLEYPPAETSDQVSSAVQESPQPTAMQDDKDDDSLQHQMNLLSRAQKLYALANSLSKPSDRIIYLKELQNVGGLLAYKVPETSSMAKYLSQERREAVADQINSAILSRSGLPSISSLELMTRYTSTVWSFANQRGVKVRPGAPLPPVDGNSNKSTSTTSPKGADKEQEVVPQFDLQQFLDSKP